MNNQEYLKFLWEGFQIVNSFTKKLITDDKMLKELKHIQCRKFTLEELNEYLANSPKTELLQSIFTFEKKGYLNREDSYEIFYKYREPDNHKYFDDYVYNQYEESLIDIYVSKEGHNPYNTDGDNFIWCDYFFNLSVDQKLLRTSNQIPNKKEMLRIIFINTKHKYEKKYFVKYMCGLEPYETEQNQRTKWWKAKFKELGYLNRYDKVIVKDIVREMKKNKRKLLIKK